MAAVEKFNFSYLSSIVYSVRFVVPGAMALVTARNTGVTERVIESRAYFVVIVVDQGEEVVDQGEEVVILVDQGETCKYWNVL